LPLRRLAGRWLARKGVDLKLPADGSEHRAFIETMDIQPIDAQANGPQLFCGLRYHAHVSTVDDIEHAFRTDIYTITVAFHADGSRSHITDTQLTRDGAGHNLFARTDHNTPQRIGEARPNPWAAILAERSTS
jgi:hypothetical protein